jgi:hypothetical protein
LIQMSLELRATWGDIANYLETRGSPLGLTRVINFMPGTSAWLFSFRIDETGLVIAEVRPDPVAEIPWQDLVTGLIPELLNCDRLEFADGKQRVELVGLRGYLGARSASHKLPEPTSAPASEVGIRLTGYWSEMLPPELGRPKEVRTYLHRHTRMGSLDSTTPPVPTVRWRVLASPEMQFRPDPLPTGKGVLNPTSVRVGGCSFVLHATPQMKKTVVRHGMLGECGELAELEPLKEAVANAGISKFVLEVDTTTGLVTGPLGEIRSTRELAGDVSTAISQVQSIVALKEYVRFQADAKREEAAWKLDQRIKAARSVDVVVARGRQLALSPRSELATVALFSKMEGAGILPFDKFYSQEFASGEGIDVLADFKIRSSDVMNTLAPVEFEFSFDNFISHKHPHQHVRMVICWKLGPKGEQLLERTELDWVRMYFVDDSSVPVVVMSALPEVELMTQPVGANASSN